MTVIQMKRRIRFTRSQMQRARRLLHMKYKPSEIAEEIGCQVHTIYRVYIPAGCPHEREGAHFWIVGDLFRDWMLAQHRETKRKGGAKMKSDQGYCVMCEKAVAMKGPFTVRPVSAQLELALGHCSECGAVVCRGQKKGNGNDLQTELP